MPRVPLGGHCFGKSVLNRRVSWMFMCVCSLGGGDLELLPVRAADPQSVEPLRGAGYRGLPAETDHIEQLVSGSVMLSLARAMVAIVVFG